MGDRRFHPEGTRQPRCGERLMRYFFRRVHNPADAADLVQETYLRFMCAPAAQTLRSPEAYLLTIAANLLKRFAKQSARNASLVSIDEVQAGLPAIRDEPSFEAERREQSRSIDGALRELSPRARAVLLLQRRDGHTLKEVACFLGIAQETARKDLAAALRHCRESLAGLCDARRG
jgi:RNA polymerase sigma factor (sigma-70 family)